jgi:hypothetical protein
MPAAEVLLMQNPKDRSKVFFLSEVVTLPS